MTTTNGVAATVTRYLDAVVAHDWPTLGTTVSADVVRIGPFGDVYRGREAYVAFLADLMPRLEGYAMRVDRVLEVGSVACVELTETVTMDGTPTDTAESLVFDLDGSGAIARIAIYIRQPAPTA
jgi:hypothetical protein